MAMRRGTTVRIEELVLRGFAREDGHRIAAAIEGELSRLFTESGGLSLGGDARRLDSGVVNATASTDAAITGGLVGGAIYRAIVR
jgi:hypothetical protein